MKTTFELPLKDSIDQDVYPCTITNHESISIKKFSLKNWSTFFEIYVISINIIF
jgi:hypothetical protein